jgi:PTS system mannose-specific IIA component
MIGMVLVTHGQLAVEFRAALEHVVGPQTQLVCQVNSGAGVVVLTDMFGGTPSNLALSCMNGGSVEVVAGINLPMLIKLASVRDEEALAEAVLHAQEAGRKYINVASRVLAGK